MKKIVSIISATILCLMAGCKPDKCDGDLYVNGPLPDECYDCQKNAPASATVSWTGYNTVAEARDCFVCHENTLHENEGKSIRLKGWLYWGGNGEWGADYMTDPYVTLDVNWMYLTDKENHSGGDNVFTVVLDKEQYEKFRENKDAFIEKRWYVSGILRCNNLNAGGCCSHSPYIEVVEFDTINVIGQ